MDDQNEACFSMCDLLSLPACSIILSFSLLAVSPKHVSEYVFSGHLPKYVRSCLCSSLFGLLCQMQSPVFYLCILFIDVFHKNVLVSNNIVYHCFICFVVFVNYLI